MKKSDHNKRLNSADPVAYLGVSGINNFMMLRRKVKPPEEVKNDE